MALLLWSGCRSPSRSDAGSDDKAESLGSGVEHVSGWEDVYAEERLLARAWQPDDGLALTATCLKKPETPVLAVSFYQKSGLPCWSFVLWPMLSSRFTLSSRQSKDGRVLGSQIRATNMSREDFDQLRRIADSIKGALASEKGDGSVGLLYDHGPRLTMWIATDRVGGLRKISLGAREESDESPIWSLAREAVSVVAQYQVEAVWK